MKILSRSFLITTIILLALPLTGSAQRLFSKGSTIEDLIPKDWHVTQAQGDLNKDGITDLAMIVIPNDENQTEVRDNDTVSNVNSPILAIYKGLREGGYSLMKLYDDIMEELENEGVSIDRSIEITDRGVLKIFVSYFFTMGGWSVPSATYLFRLQNGDFYLIGKDTNVFSRNTGEAEKVSYNYLTRKCQRILYNAMEDNVKPKEKWSNLPKKPLQRLGTFTISAE
jgi:hypothetical protein